MLRGYRFRIYPTQKEAKTLNRQMFLSKELYNLLLKKANSYYRETGKFFTRNRMNLWIRALKQERKEFNEVYSQVLQNVSDRIWKGYQNFFRRIKERNQGKKTKAGFPRVKTFVQSLTYPQFGFELVKKKVQYVRVSNIGLIPVVLDRQPQGTVKTMTIKKSRSGEFHASFLARIKDTKFVSNRKPVVGMDLGLESYATLSNGKKIPNPRAMERGMKRLRMRHREVSRKRRGGRNWRNAVIRLAKLSERITRQRDDYLHKISHNLVNSYSFIAFERLGIKNMLKNHRFARSISDASWSNFIRMLCYKAENAGCRVEGVDPRNTSRTCSRCGAVQDVPLSQRTYACANCGMSMDRDINAAVNILQESTAGHAGIHASGDVAATTPKDVASRIDEPGTIHVGTDAGNHTFRCGRMS